MGLAAGAELDAVEVQGLGAGVVELDPLPQGVTDIAGVGEHLGQDHRPVAPARGVDEAVAVVVDVVPGHLPGVGVAVGVRVVAVPGAEVGGAGGETVAVPVETIVHHAVAVVVDAVTALGVLAVGQAVSVGVGLIFVDEAVAVVVHAVTGLGVEAVGAAVVVGVGQALIDVAIAVVVRFVAQLGRAREDGAVVVVAVVLGGVAVSVVVDERVAAPAAAVAAPGVIAGGLEVVAAGGEEQRERDRSAQRGEGRAEGVHGAGLQGSEGRRGGRRRPRGDGVGARRARISSLPKQWGSRPPWGRGRPIGRLSAAPRRSAPRPAGRSRRWRR